MKLRTILMTTTGVVVLCVFGGCSSKQPGGKTKAEMNDFAQRYAEAWSTNEPFAVTKFFSETGSLQVNDGPVAVGRQEIAKIARGFMSEFPKMVVSMDKVVVKGETIEFHWTLDGVNSGLRGTGKRVRISGYEEWKFGPDGLISESKGHLDEAEYKRQIEHGVKEGT